MVNVETNYDREANGTGNERSPDFRQLWNTHGNEESEASSKENDGGEKGAISEPPQPVPVFDRSLKQLRSKVFGLWTRMGEKTKKNGVWPHS